MDDYEPMETRFKVKISADVQFDDVQYLYIGKNETMDEGFIGCVSRVEFNDIYPLKLLFQQSPPYNILSLGKLRFFLNRYLTYNMASLLSAFGLTASHFHLLFT